ncbi:MAG: ankyrin repeat domain-containing protein [Candidatus Vogelbacteria bacterium]|nr:ankyrin repeat domain-containing protein [Candidatus Vogelbacteria bacterium]
MKMMRTWVPDVGAIRLQTSIVISCAALALFLISCDMVSSRETALLRASAYGELDHVKMLLDQGVDPNVQSREKQVAPLMVASLRGHIDVASLLLAHGANINATDHNGVTALMAAAQGGHLEVAKLLIASGAVLTAEDNDGVSAETYAGERNHLDVKQLIEDEVRKRGLSKLSIHEFAKEIIEALRQNDSAQLYRLTTSAQEGKRFLDFADTKKVFFEAPQWIKLSDREQEKAVRETIIVFQRSYEEIGKGVQERFSSRIGDELGDVRLIIWMRSEQGYQGILIWSVVPTESGYRVLNWIGPTSQITRGSTLRTKTAYLRCVWSEECIFPKEEIQFDYSFTH